MIIERTARAAELRRLRGAFRSLAAKWPWPVPVTVDGGRRLYVDLRSAIGRGMLVTGRFDPALGDFLRKTLRPGDTFVDVGANVGVFSLIALEAVGETGVVHAFEIDPRAISCLERTRRANRLSNLVLHVVAVGAHAGVVSLVQTDDVGHSHVAPAGPEGFRFPVLPLDAWLDHFVKTRLHVLKVDVEGSELDVLKGAERVLRTCRPLVVCEAESTHQERFGRAVSDIEIFMSGLGYDADELSGCNDRTLIFRCAASDSST